MYRVTAQIKGTAPLLQHAFGQVALDEMAESAKKRIGTIDYSLEWLTTLYQDNEGYLVQPASHIEGAMRRTAGGFKMKGKNGKSWRETVQAYAYVLPEMIRHIRNGQYVMAPGPELLQNPTEFLSVSIMRVKVQRAAVARSRLMIAPGWELAFSIDVQDDQLRPDVVKGVLEESGRAGGIGDYRPRYGRFEVTAFTVQ